jgi:hypothetical protein
MAEKWVICASGPSMLRVDLAMLRRFRSWRVMVINNTWELIPWADVLYAGDGQWWERYGDEAAGFRGEKWTSDAHAAVRRSLHWIRYRSGTGLCRESSCVHSGGNSGYRGINLAYHFGARRIVLLGFDMHRREGGHWHGEHDGMLSAPESHIAVWRREFDALAFDLKAEGVRVVNATEGTALTCFPQASLVEALKC